MDSCHGKPNDKAIPFYSGAKAPHCLLSNFSACKVYYEGVWYPSSEHAFQASRVPPGMREQLFSINSDIAKLTPEAFVAVGVPAKQAEGKVKHWGKKNMVGILAKQRINRMRSKFEQSKEECERAFIEILLSKYKSNHRHREALLATGDTFLLEFVRSSESKFDKQGEIDRWGGMIRGGTKAGELIMGGSVVGHNQQGSLQMHVRSILQKEE
jgi:predicted NAD-dependent protein-ADP-ribosyltransferase YbiA (DUF1768 family)